jgi:hypothetical protein
MHVGGLPCFKSSRAGTEFLEHRGFPVLITNVVPAKHESALELAITIARGKLTPLFDANTKGGAEVDSSALASGACLHRITFLDCGLIPTARD